MTVHRILGDNHAFDPDGVDVLVFAYENALRDLRLGDREAPPAVAVARKIVELAKQGLRDGAQLRDAAVASFRAQVAPLWEGATSAPSTPPPI